MKHLRELCAVILLTSTLTVAAGAGVMGTPLTPPPPPPPPPTDVQPVEGTSTNEADVPLVDVVLSTIVQTVISAL